MALRAVLASQYGISSIRVAVLALRAVSASQYGGPKYIGAGREPRVPYGDGTGGRLLHGDFDGGMGGVFDYQ